MKTKLISLLILLAVIVVFNSCCKKQKCKCKEEWGEEVDDCTPKHFGPYYLGEVKDYLYFKPGSWWVYENNLTGETDSIYTVLCDTAFNEVTGKDEKWLTLSYTSIGFRLRSDKYDVDYYFDQRPRFPHATDFNFNLVMDKMANFPTFGANSVPFSYPFNPAIKQNFNELISSMDIKGKTYTDVAVFQVSPDNSVQHPTNIPYPLYFQATVKYYWAKNYGLVKIEAKTYRNDTGQEVYNNWELTKSNLIK
jgi:hypothetical protein